AERMAGFGSGDGVGLTAHLVDEGVRRGVVGRQPRRERREDDEGDGDAEAEEEDRVAPQTQPGRGDESDTPGVLDPAGLGDRRGRPPAVREVVDALLASRSETPTGLRGGLLVLVHRVLTRGSITA